MKKSISIAAFMLATSITVFSSAQAQSPAPVNNMLNFSSHSLVGKTIVTEESSVNSKVLKSFHRNFKTKTPVRWSTDEKFYLAYFVKDGIQHRVTYRKNGGMIQTLKTYSAEHLNRDVRSQVEETYDGYDITGVTELTQNYETVYFVNIESRRKLKEVVAYNGQLMVRKQFDIK
ncbi:MAG: hypothetical protein EOO04_24720 [Chitinophagaceae bacterium]|nr:MAG: hypothetical protein EOO04_24720 [Chitinophagaceae bacterium]